jgi:hypothetical protein
MSCEALSFLIHFFSSSSFYLHSISRMQSFRLGGKERFVVMGVLIMGIILTDMSALLSQRPAGVMLSSSTSEEASRGRQSAKTETGGNMEMKQIAEDMKNMQSTESLFHTDKIHPTKGNDLASIQADMKHMLTAKGQAHICMFIYSNRPVHVVFIFFVYLLSILLCLLQMLITKYFLAVRALCHCKRAPCKTRPFGAEAGDA